ncbi:threonine synthase [Vallitalea pronyensis]|uniref:Threonine synthase n=1 Tax=Vallitalea pronyensis TaxID=1348613 RepID=A0A8J8MK91_9FIRM|nr:threonine synthase [Vallitalea pronyensis]QUI22848.1 threonine synthase [Vallitalea pronyensis]
MGLMYRSTRGGESNVPASMAIIKGLACDGGLFVPHKIPKMNKSLEDLSGLTYKELAYEVMSLFFTDFTKDELTYCIEHAYDKKFDTDAIAPLVKKGDAYYLELFHGATIAFKDMALSILPYLMKVSAKKQQIDNDIVILTATSGDTGKAALAGFADVEGIKIIVFYPKDGVSPIQKHQMVTQKGDNTYVVGIEGNFDDAQNGVKEIFSNEALAETMNRQGYQFSSANSINIGRLIPQVVYYFYAYCNMLKHGDITKGETINMVVPTGNFGNILAAYYAKNMGLPIHQLICASNDNKVLYDFMQTGVYNKKRDFILTISPSMDILISSNLERLLYNLADGDHQKIRELMTALSQEGEYIISDAMRSGLDDFYGEYASMDETYDAIKDVFHTTHYLMDSHTAVGHAVYKKYKTETKDSHKTVIVSTASPYKFTRSVMKAIDKRHDQETDFDLIHKMHELTGVPIPKAIQEILDAEVRHTRICDKNKMQETVKDILGLN